MVNFIKLISQCIKKYGNPNIIFALLFLANNFTLFGGCLRDYFAKTPSKDIDLLVSFDKFPLFSYENGDFNDKFIEYIKSILLVHGITVLDVQRKIDVLEKEGRYTEATEPVEELFEQDDYLEQVDDAELLHVINNPTADPDHIKYQLKLLIGDDKYDIIIDISFVTQELLTNIPFKPAVIQDSCFIRNNTTNLLSSELTLEMVEEFYNKKVESYIEAVDIDKLKTSLYRKNIEPYELNDKKRALKLARLIFEEGWTLNLSDQQLGTFDQYTLTSILIEIQKKHFDAPPEEQQQLQHLEQKLLQISIL